MLSIFVADAHEERSNGMRNSWSDVPVNDCPAFVTEMADDGVDDVVLSDAARLSGNGNDRDATRAPQVGIRLLILRLRLRSIVEVVDVLGESFHQPRQAFPIAKEPRQRVLDRGVLSLVLFGEFLLRLHEQFFA